MALSTVKVTHYTRYPISFISVRGKIFGWKHRCLVANTSPHPHPKATVTKGHQQKHGPAGQSLTSGVSPQEGTRASSFAASIFGLLLPDTEPSS